jgi:peptidoglycan/LPS O-acetylase OafA/YrhL
MRPVTSRGRIPALDGVRGVAILLVVLGHAALLQRPPEWLRASAQPLLSGELGVLIFFVLSGYLITSILLRERERTGTISLRAFYARRALRIWPAFYAYLAVAAVLAATGAIAASSGELAAAALYVWNYAPDVSSWWLGHTWSLAVEEQFYLLWPLTLLLLGPRRAFRVSVAILACEPLLRVVEYAVWPGGRGHIPVYLHTRADSLMTGAALALLPVAAPALAERLRRATARTPFVLAAVGGLLLFPYASDRLHGRFDLTVGWTLANVSTAFLIAVALGPGGRVRRVLEQRWLTTLGVLSYSLYLWQQLFLTDADSWLPRNAALGIACALAAAWLSHQLVESPFLALKERFSRGEPAPAAAPEIPAAPVPG